jgi:DNA polymerase IV (DinB-like DNA polymerase)
LAAAQNLEVSVPLQSRVVMLVDLDYFFAQCEELRNPTLKDKPVVVGVYSGRTEESGAVSTANYLARKYGVKSGIPLFLAKKRLEGTEAVFLPVDHEFYEKVSNGIMQTLRSYADSFEQVGIDEAYLDVTQKVQGSFDLAEDVARHMKLDVQRQHGINFSVGIAPNKLVAKIACDSQKPNGLTVVKPEMVERFLSPLPVDRLLGVGRKISARMDGLGIKTIGDLARINAQRLVEVFGKSLGAYFHNAANGVDDDAVQEAREAESISRIGTLKVDTRDLSVILEKTDKLVEDVQKELLENNQRFKQVGVIAVMTDLSVRSRSLTLEQPTNDLQTLKRAVRELFEKFLGDSELELRRVGVKVSHLVKQENSQKRLTSFIAKQ